MSEWEITVRANVTNTFYIEADTEEEAKIKAESMSSSQIENTGMSVNDIEEIDVCEC